MLNPNFAPSAIHVFSLFFVLIVADTRCTALHSSSHVHASQNTHSSVSDILRWVSPFALLLSSGRGRAGASATLLCGFPVGGHVSSSSPPLFLTILVTDAIMISRYGRSLSTKLFFASLFVGLFSCAPTFVEVLLRKRYPMLRRGAVLITGASKGIGRAAVDAVVREGFTVYAGVRKQEDYDALQALNNTRVRPIKLDIDDQASVDAAFDLISSELPDLKTPLLSGVVNNAAWGARGPVEFTDLETVRQMFETNVVGQLRVTQKFLPLLRANHGRVVFISSILGKFATPNTGIYSATKHALEAVADSLRQELLPLGVPVCVIEPGVVETSFHEQAAANLNVSKDALHVYPHLFTKAKDEFRQRLLSRGAKVEEISLYILHALLSPTPLPRLACGNLDGLPASWVLWLTWMLPDRLRDVIFA